MASSTDVLRKVGRLLDDGDRRSAAELLRRDLPFQTTQPTPRTIAPADALKVFLRDGFIDRYSGEKLVFPGTLRLLSTLLPDELPFHPGWNMSQCHIIYWQLYPTIDHVIPVERGGSATEANWVTTSLSRSSAKGGATLAEIGWELVPRGRLAEWDGLYGWFREFVESHPELATVPGVTEWRPAAHESG